MKYSRYQESSVIHGWLVYWVLVEKCVACQNSVIRFRMASFSFKATVASLDSFQELNLEW